MVHLGFPNLTSDDDWAEEGLATYVEPLARTRLGTLSEDKVWSDLMEGVPKGMPQRGDRGDGILDAGGDIRVRWDLQRTLAVADKAVGLTVLSDLYREMGTKAGAVDLQDLWRRLGVRRVGGRVAYDDSAPLAQVRRAITSAPQRRFEGTAR